MSTLNRNELKDLAKSKNLLGDDYIDVNFQPSSYDLRIGSIFKDNEIFSKEFEKKNFTNCVDIKPSEIVSILTLEKVTIPSDCLGTVFAINRQSSKGLLILNPGHIDPGYSGYLSICAINLSKETITISLGESIFTLLVQKLNIELKADELYKNKPYNSRKEEEQFFLKNNAKKLSNSFFDLVSGYPGAKKMLSELIWDRVWRYAKLLFKIILLLAAIAGILKLGYIAFPGKMPIFKQSENMAEDSLLLKKDSVINKQKLEIISLKDSITNLRVK